MRTVSYISMNDYTMIHSDKVIYLSLFLFNLNVLIFKCYDLVALFAPTPEDIVYER